MGTGWVWIQGTKKRKRKENGISRLFMLQEYSSFEEPVLYAKSSCHGPESPWHDQSLIDNFQTGTEGTQRQNIVIRDSVV